MIRLLLCDDTADARAALRAMLHEQGEIEIVGEAADGEQAVALATQLAPDVVLMDVAMPVLDGIAATAQIRPLLPAARIVAFAGSAERDVVEAMLEAGADAYCVKGAPLWELERVIAGAGDPLLRLAHSLTRSASGGIGALVARELHDLTGGAIAAVYLTSETGLSLAGAAEELVAARVAQRSVRADEEMYRFGGDEFALLIEGVNTMSHVVERLLRAVRLHRRPRPLPTFSVGVANSPADGRSKAELLARADEALYAHKRAGKSTVVVTQGSGSSDAGTRVLVIDDDAGLRTLLHTTLEAIELDVEEVDSAARARTALVVRRPDLIVLDIGLPDTDGLSFCRELKGDPRTAAIPVIILTGSDAGTSEDARAALAEGFLRKPFSPLELLAMAERLLGRLDEALPRRDGSDREDQVQLYAQDLRRLLEIERGQRVLLQHAYRQTVGALAAALESKDVGTGAHSKRVLMYAGDLARAVDPSLLDEPSIEYGFLLHDVGKIGIPDSILRKRGPLTPGERAVLETHTLLGEQMLGGVPLLAGGGIRVVRSHHERWDGRGYPDRLAGRDIPLGARVFAIADTLDAMTSDRPYRAALGWDEAVAEIAAQSARQFDPEIVEAFGRQEPSLRRIYYELTAT